MKDFLNLTRLASLLVCAMFVMAPQAHAARHDISMTADDYEPAYLEVLVGDRVYWWNDDYDFFDLHSTRSYTYPWNSGPIGVGYGVYLDMTKTGSYDYTDDWGFSGWGTVVVKPNTPPTPPQPTTLTQPLRLGDGSFQCTISNLVVDWTGIYTGVASGTTETYVHPEAATFGQNFYRVIAVP